MQKYIIAASLIFLLITGYFTCLKSGKGAQMCEKRGGCWVEETQNCEFEDLTKCKK